jgi:8-oxo-dGTP pyrophosphatase MutT (NUDIX family)
LVPLYEAQDGPGVILVHRTEQVPTHKGQISFPGGGYHESDGDLTVTALRESHEEIGLRAADVTLLGRLDDVVTAASAHVVRPVVGLVPASYPFRLDPFEVQRLIHLPLAPLLAGAPFREEIWQRDGAPHSVFFYEADGQTIWGLTARILKRFVELVRAA